MNYHYDPEKIMQKEYDVLASHFFSNENVNKVQNGITQYFNNKGMPISRQSPSELFIIMRSLYSQYSTNDQNNIQSEVERLNSLTVNECIRLITPNILQYMQYMKDIRENKQSVLDHGISTSGRGVHNENNFANMMY